MRAKVLVIDDDLDFLNETKALLELCGSDVDIAYHENEWMKKVEKNPDLILLDRILKYPSGEVDGFTICKTIKQNEDLAKIPIVFISGCYDLKDKEKSFSLGAEGYFAKPYDAEELIDFLEMVLLRKNDAYFA